MDKIDATDSPSVYSQVSAKYEKLFSSEEVRWLTAVYSALYPKSEVVHVPMAHEVLYDIEIFGELLTSVKSNGNHSSTITAYGVPLLNLTLVLIMYYYFVQQTEESIFEQNLHFVFFVYNHQSHSNVTCQYQM